LSDQSSSPRLLKKRNLMPYPVPFITVTFRWSSANAGDPLTEMIRLAIATTCSFDALFRSCAASLLIGVYAHFTTSKNPGQVVRPDRGLFPNNDVTGPVTPSNSSRGLGRSQMARRTRPRPQLRIYCSGAGLMPASEQNARIILLYARRRSRSVHNHSHE